eukprot:1158076-Pelagomonas_calceolata.AAC.7
MPGANLCYRAAGCTHQLVRLVLLLLRTCRSGIGVFKLHTHPSLTPLILSLLFSCYTQGANPWVADKLAKKTPLMMACGASTQVSLTEMHGCTDEGVWVHVYPHQLRPCNAVCAALGQTLVGGLWPRAAALSMLLQVYRITAPVESIVVAASEVCCWCLT